MPLRQPAAYYPCHWPVGGRQAAVCEKCIRDSGPSTPTCTVLPSAAGCGSSLPAQLVFRSQFPKYGLLVVMNTINGIIILHKKVSLKTDPGCPVQPLPPNHVGSLLPALQSAMTLAASGNGRMLHVVFTSAPPACLVRGWASSRCSPLHGIWLHRLPQWHEIYLNPAGIGWTELGYVPSFHVFWVCLQLSLNCLTLSP